ncbi:tryptophan--tRNA ligase [Candidatus Saccharibacteria bacterium]|nr:tryptophan--tRNA ligase [Candidatus Saccharibacteria bacterium]
MSKQETILTGVRVSDGLTLGNYLGAYVPMANLARWYSSTHRFNAFIPDLHSITTPVDYSSIQKNTMNSIKYYLAAGFDDIKDNENVNFYRQSRISGHSEMAWILDCFASVGELSRMTQFKEKAVDILGDKPDLGEEGITERKARGDFVSAGLFTYPVLMAADILLYDARFVPVGEDQFQHVELTRDIGMRMNNRFSPSKDSPIFVVPEKTEEQVKFMDLSQGLRIRSLTEPEKKMSKSHAAAGSKILLDDDPKVAAKKIMGATTDSFGLVRFDMFNQPGISNLMQILSLLSGKPLQEVVGEWSGQTQYGDLKRATAEAVERFLVDFQSRVANITDGEIGELLERGEERMRPVAAKKVEEVQRAVGLR